MQRFYNLEYVGKIATNGKQLKIWRKVRMTVLSFAGEI
jgi:hypothetical protein